jgi:hypothetical protein
VARRQEQEASLESVKKLEQVGLHSFEMGFFACFGKSERATYYVHLLSPVQQLREASQTALELKERQIKDLTAELHRLESALDEQNKKHHSRDAEVDHLRSDVRFMSTHSSKAPVVS